MFLRLSQKTMNNTETIAVYIPDEDVKKFLLFQQHYLLFNTLIDKGVFNVKNGSITLHFDSEGELQLIQRADILFSKRFESQ